MKLISISGTVLHALYPLQLLHLSSLSTLSVASAIKIRVAELA